VDGKIYEKAFGIYYPGSTYAGKNITHGRAYSAPFWREVDLPFSEPALLKQQFDKLTFAEESK
jgi:hypothetical protein